MLAKQMVAPNSPQWFNTGLHWAYGVDGPGQGHYYVDWKTGKLTKSKSAYEHPQPHACFIQGIEDDLVNEGGIMDLWVREARLFKYGSGTGSNFSRLRGEGEKLSGGGRSSGLMSFLKIGDRAAGAIKSGGTTRRAAKMVVVDADHPDIETYIDWKVKEEQKVAALVTGSKLNQKHLKAVLKACVNCEGSGDDCFDPEKNPALRREIKLARRALVADGMIKRVIQFAKQGYKEIDFPIYDTDWDSEAYLTVSGQNSNNSVSLKDDFLRAVETDGDWNLIGRTSKKVTKTLKARDLWEKIGYAAWAVGRSRPALQHHHERLAHLQGVRRHPRLQSVLGIHVPGRHRLQSGVRQPDHLLQHHDQAASTSTLRASLPALDARARNLRDDGAVPLQGDRGTVLRIPHAGPRLCQYRRAADDHGPFLRQQGRPRAVRRAVRDHDRHRPTRPRPRWRRSSAPSPATRRTPRTCCG